MLRYDVAMQMPSLDLDFSDESAAENREKIDSEIHKQEAVILYLKGLHTANQAICKHAAKYSVYDPGYAGGGHDGYKCETCGKRGYF